MHLVDIERFDVVTEDKKIFYSLPECAAFRTLAAILRTMKTG